MVLYGPELPVLLGAVLLGAVLLGAVLLGTEGTPSHVGVGRQGRLRGTLP
jgi:hypothetical protein